MAYDNFEAFLDAGVASAEYTRHELFNNAANEGFSPDDGGFLGHVTRPIGLTARYGFEGAAQSAHMITEPIRKNVTDPASRVVGLLDKDKSSKSAGQIASDIADFIGLPSPQNAQERIVGDISRGMAGAGTWFGAAQKAGQLYQGLSNSGSMQSALNWLAEKPASQTFSGASGGLASGATREAGGGEVAQDVAGVLGGFAGGAGFNAVQNAGKKVFQGVSNALNPMQTAAELEITVAQTLGRQGIDWSAVPRNIKNGILQEAEAALKTGNDLAPVVLKRLLDFKTVGATPTRGTLTLDPAQITREQNLVRTGANASDQGLDGFARVQNQNNQALIDAMNRLGAETADDAYTAGNRVISALQGSIDADRANINNLYSAARDTSGRSVPLNRSVFTNKASDMLDEAMVGASLPADVRNTVNRIAQGEIPFTVEIAEQLKTRIGKLQRSTNDGQTKYALGLVRQALDDPPLMNTASSSSAIDPAQPNIGQEAISAFNAARVANRNMMRRIEGNPALKSLYDGTASPDDFVQKFIVSKGAKVDDVKELAKQLKQIDPSVLDTVRGRIADYLKTAAIGQGTADEVGKFSASGFRKAMQDIGYYKMSAFFSQDEIRQLRAVMNVANYTSVQPIGSAVNNSNSGALMIGRGLDMLDKLAGNVPIMGVFPTANNISRNLQQRSAQNITKALTSKSANPLLPAPQPGSVISPAAVSQKTTRDLSQGADKGFDAEEYRYARNAAMRAGDYDAVRILDENARKRGYRAYPVAHSGL